jgi:hypothetical protein
MHEGEHAGEWRKAGGRYRFGEWSLPDPHDHALHDALHDARYDLAHLSQGQAYRILAAAEAYVHLAGHPAGTEAMVRQLRAIRQAVWEDAHPAAERRARVVARRRHAYKVTRWQAYRIYWAVRGGACTVREAAAAHGVAVSTVNRLRSTIARLYRFQRLGRPRGNPVLRWIDRCPSAAREERTIDA